MPFVITRYAIGKHPKSRITRGEYVSLKIEKDFILEFTFIEQKFDLLIENYIDFENYLLSLATRDMIQNNMNFNYVTEQRLVIIRLMSNLLSSFRLYIDHTAHHLSVISKTKADLKAVFNDAKSQKYDENIEYQTMEALRNYCQHRGFPIHTVTFGAKWDNSSSSEIDDNTNSSDIMRMSFQVTPYLNLDELKNDKKFKKTVSDRLEAEGYEVINLVVFVRKYIGLISEIHQNLRDNFDTDIIEARTLLIDKIEQFERRAKESNPVGMAAMSLDMQGIKREEPVFLSRRLIEYLDAIRNKNIKAINLDRRYVTNIVL